MAFYSIALFLHITGALGLFIALGLEWTSLWYLRRATTAEQADQWLLVFTLLRRIYPVSWAAILLPGIYMMATIQGGGAWVGVAFAAMLLLPIVGASLTGRRMAAIGPMVATERGSISFALRERLHDPLLWLSIQTRVAIALGIVFLMTVKPGLSGALLTMGVAVVLGLASALPAWNRVQLQEAREER
jgi:hypothetical protein